ncbi:hypothetical protein [Sphingomonas sp. SORGH_AS_0438]|uniref:hypothetical protein n=1 Tax=Sphingomonas sp. SORGH_AS_0438 TaxID=3041756 RepID=UPI00285DA64F|nr:hypothetical protein [Sphingomonas sp. SORGH_AS_0438]MDR6129090.1 hypothetical protein [Sphingomonas sp. SORGH_AS_0438]
MGVDFIREQSGKAWRKRWNMGLDRMKTPTLFDVQFAEQARTVSADLDTSCNLHVGDQVVVQCNGADVIVCSGQRCIGAIPGIPAQMRLAIAGGGGVALGIVERVGLFGTHAELSIR